MNNKILYLTATLLVLLIAFAINVSAAASMTVDIADIQDMARDSTQTVDVTVTNTGDDVLTNIILSVTNSDNTQIQTRFADDGIDPVNYSYYVIPTLNVEPPKTVKLTITTDEDATFKAYTVTVNAISSEILTPGISDSDDFEVEYRYCTLDDGYIDVTDVDIVDKQGEYLPGDKFTIQVDVENNDNDEHDVSIKAVLVKDNVEYPDTEEEIDKSFNLDDDEEKLNSEIELEIPDDAEDGEWYVYVKAFDEDDEDNCREYSVSFDVDRPTRGVNLKGLKTIPEKVECGSSIQVSGKIANIGEKDEDKIKVTYSDQFGNTKEKVFNSVDSGDDETFSFTNIAIPFNAKEGTSRIKIDVEYNYDDDDEVYDEVEHFEKFITIEGNCAKANGEIVEVKVTSPRIFKDESYNIQIYIKNTGNVKTKYNVTALNVDPKWSTFGGDATVELEAGSEGYATLTFTALEEGTKEVTIKVTYEGGEKTTKVPVTITPFVEPKSDSEKFAEELKANLLWVVIVAVLVILTIVLIVALALSGKKHKVAKVEENDKVKLKKK